MKVQVCSVQRCGWVIDLKWILVAQQSVGGHTITVDAAHVSSCGLAAELSALKALLACLQCGSSSKFVWVLSRAAKGGSAVVEGSLG
jgi:hypothetical protein